MGLGVLIIGSSGMGKSASLRTFTQSISLINVLGKPLPFRATGNIKAIQTDNASQIISLLQRAQSDSIVIDDAGYIISNFYMTNKAPLSAKLNDKFSVYDVLATNFWKIINSILTLPPNKIVYMLMHEDRSDTGKIKPKTVGKMLDNIVCIEGCFSIVLRADKREENYIFYTNTEGDSVAKSPIGMFPETINNDLAYVDEIIRNYYGLNNKGD
jgi:hypothetical protein